MNVRRIFCKGLEEAGKEFSHQVLAEGPPVVRTSARAAMRLKRAVDTTKGRLFKPKRPSSRTITQGELDRGYNR